MKPENRMLASFLSCLIGSQLSRDDWSRDKNIYKNPIAETNLTTTKRLGFSTDKSHLKKREGV